MRERDERDTFLESAIQDVVEAGGIESEIHVLPQDHLHWDNGPIALMLKVEPSNRDVGKLIVLYEGS